MLYTINIGPVDRKFPVWTGAGMAVMTTFMAALSANKPFSEISVSDYATVAAIAAFSALFGYLLISWCVFSTKTEGGADRWQVSRVRSSFDRLKDSLRATGNVSDWMIEDVENAIKEAEGSDS